jgi:hypothetical protein
MQTTREHLAASHLADGEHHTKCAKCHAALAKSHKEMAKHLETTDPAGNKLHGAIGAEHDSLAAHHTTAAEFHLQCCKDLAAAEKAMQNEIVPSRASVINMDPGNPHAGRTVPVVRLGQPTPEQRKAAEMAIPVELEAITGPAIL